MDKRERLQALHRQSSDDILAALLYYLQMDSHRGVLTDMFSCTPFDPDQPFYYCQTGMDKALYTHRISISGQSYSRLYFHIIEPALKEMLQDFDIVSAVYMIVDDSKEIGVVFQPESACSITPLEIAECISRTVQSLYDKHFPKGTGHYYNTTALSEPVTGVEGIREGYLQTEALKAASFFRMTPSVITMNRLNSLKNSATYRDVINLARLLCQATAQGDGSKMLALTEKLFLDLLKHSYDMELVRDALSYIKQFLSIRLSVHLPSEAIDLTALCSPSSYIIIEECYEAIHPVLDRLCRAVQKTGPWCDVVTYAAYFLRSNLEQDVSLSDVAAFADTTPAYLSSLFHQQTGMTIKQYQQMIRMEHACLLLKTTDDRVADVAIKTGFMDRRYFTRIFKDAFGMTPQEYRLSR